MFPAFTVLASDPAVKEEKKEEKLCGIPLDRVVNASEKKEIIELFTCQICKLLARDIQIDKGGCESAFCEECLKDFWGTSYSKKCPLNCRNPQFGPASRTDKVHLKGLLISCKFKEQGCMEIVTYEDLNSHESSCKFLPIKCQAYNLCKTLDSKDKISIHEGVCEFVPSACESCKQEILRKDLSSHSCIAHLLLLLEQKEKQLSEREQKDTKPILTKEPDRRSQDLERMMQSMEMENHMLKRALAQSQEQNAQSQNRIHQHAREMEALACKVRDLSEQNQELQAAVSRNEGSLSSPNSKNVDNLQMREKIAQLELHVRELKTKQEMLLNEKERLVANLEKRALKENEMKKELLHLQEAYADVKIALSHKK